MAVETLPRLAHPRIGTAVLYAPCIVLYIDDREFISWPLVVRIANTLETYIETVQRYSIVQRQLFARECRFRVGESVVSLLIAERLLIHG